jgi:hypothetical protein
VAHVMMTFSIGQGALRPASRAARFGWPYSYGFYALERGPEGEGFRWSGREAVSVVEATGGVLQLKAWVYHPDVSQQPVHVRVWVDSQLALDAELQSALPVMRDITVPADAARVVVRTWVDRVWRPSDHGSTDNRELGVALADWKFSHPSAPLSMASPAAVTAR